MRRSRSTETVDTSAATTGGSLPVGSESLMPLNDTVPVQSNKSSGSTVQSAKSSGSHKSAKQDYLTYLTSYEAMVSRQDMEFDATSQHAKGVFGRVRKLGSKKNADGEMERDDSAPSGMLTYLQMRRCLLRMGVGWNRFLPASGDSDYDDDVSVLSFGSTSSVHSGLSGGAGKGDIIATDAQLIMLLTTLVEMEEHHRALRLNGDDEEEKEELSRGLYLPELVQAYKLIIGGMQSLKCIANPDDPSNANLCNRLKDRTVAMIRPFGPNATMYNDPAQKTGKDDALSKTGMRSDLKDMSPGTRKKLGFSDGEMKQVLRSKDMALQQILEDHELEMDALASSMEELRAKEGRTRAAMKRRKRRARWAALLFGSIAIGGGIVVESRRRQYLADELKLGREAEREADANTIATLSEERRTLEEKLGVIEGKKRYQVNRNDELEAQTQSIATKVDAMDVKWLLDKAENERCATSLVRMTDERKRERSRLDEVDEELVWCRSRLRSQERELNELEHVRVERSDRGLLPKSTVDATKSHRPVHLEMKFNKSIRNSMRLRQAYAAAAGLAISALLQGIVPAVVRFLFVPKAIVVPPPLPTRDVEMMLVDGIFGSSVLFLLIRGIATFFVPL